MGKSYLFPYERIPAGSRVIIYAFGRVGMSYASQLHDNRYCEVVAIIDRNYGQKTCRDFPIYGPDYLRETAEYDYVVIAQKDELERNAIYAQLVMLSIDGQKIINAAPVEIFDKSHARISPDLRNLCDIVSGVTLNADFCFEYYIDVIDDIMGIYENSPRLLEMFKLCLARCEVPEEKIVLLQLFHSAGVFDGELMCVYLHTIMELDDVEWKYQFFRLSAYMIFFGSEYLYDDYYLDRRRVMEGIAGELGLSVSGSVPRRNTVGRKKRIAILALCLVDNQIGAHFLTIAYANLMQSRGYEVAVFSDEKCSDLQYITCRCGKQALVPTFYTVNAAVYNSRHERHYAPGVQLVYTDSVSRSVCARRTTKAVEKFDPDCIIDMSDDHSVLSAAFYRHYPIFQIPLRGYTSSSHFDKFLARDRAQCLESNRKYHMVQEDQMHVHDVLFSIPSTGGKYQRADYGLSESDFVLTTAGNRLATEITEDFTGAIAALLRAHPDMRWILVGEGLPECLDTAYQDLLDSGQILKWGFEEDLLAFYSMCDVFVNPDRQGAGGVIGMAMLCGVPVAATTRVMGDAWALYGSLAESGNYTELAEYVMKLKEDRTLYRSVRERSIQIIQERFGEQDDDFTAAVEDLIAHWRSE